MNNAPAHLGQIVLDAAGIFRPPERLTVAEAAVKYVRVHAPPRYSGPYKPDETPYMVEPQNMVMSREHTSVVFCGPSQTGKALPLDTPLPTPTGWTTMGDVRVGDLVIDDRGRPTEVVFVTETMLDHACYRVEFDDGTHLVADAAHVWAVDRVKAEQGYGGPATAELTTEQIAETLTFGKKRRYSYAIKNTAPLELDEAELPLAPYTLGAWLGDGHALGGRLYGSPEDLKTVITNVWMDGYEARVDIDGKGLGVLKVLPGRMVKTPGQRGQQSEFNTLLRAAGVEEKHIPSAYLRGSVRQRLELMRGLMDTDGSISKGGVCEFSNTNKRLVDGFCELAHSLGLKTLVTERQTSCTYLRQKSEGAASWRVTFVAYDDLPVFTLRRKLERQKPRSAGRPGYTMRRRIIAVEPVESVPVRCIEVASESHLYLAGRQMAPTHNTEGLIINGCAYIVKCNPMDVIVFGPSQTAARDFSKRRIDRMHRHSENLKSELLVGQHADNTHDKTYKSGMMLSISWPSGNEMSSKPVPVTMLTEYDRMPDDVDGEGSPFILAQKRTTTFGSMAMTVVDSSPSRVVEDVKWKPRTPHEAPPCTGVLGLYNQGDRRRWYWPCPHCGEFFEGHFGLLRYETQKIVNGEKVALSPKKASDTVYMECPKTGCRIVPTEKQGMNARGVWLRDGERIDKNGVRSGEGTTSESATYWLRGTAAAYVSWKTLVVKMLNAEKDYQDTGSQEALKTTVNTDQGEPYIPRGNETNRLAEDIMDSAISLPKQLVPHDVRALFAMCDVQKNRWEVQVMGIRPAPLGYDIVVIDRFPVVKSNRADEDGERLWVKPASYLEDWDLLVTEVMDKKYLLCDGSGEMAIRMTFCDSGGKEGVTSMIYDFYRKLKKEGKHHRFMPTKGENHPGSPRAVVSYPDTKRKDRLAQARGEIPVLFFNSNSLKDTLNNMLDRDTEGGGKIDFPDWLELWFFEELTVETRNVKGEWSNKAGRRNETWDLCYMFVGACVWQRVDQVDWAAPPMWLSPWEKNPLVTRVGLAQKGPVDKGGGVAQDFAALAADLA